jgi:hypothetical protein
MSNTSLNLTLTSHENVISVDVPNDTQCRQRTSSVLVNGYLHFPVN